MTDVDYSLTAPHVLDDPASAYAELRSRCPVHHGRVGESTLYSLTLRDDIGPALRNHALWSNADGPGVGYATGSGVGDMQHDDPPEHERRRGFARAWFVPPAIAALEADLRDLAETMAASLADELDRNGTADLYHGFALPMPVTAFCALMGIAIDDREQFLSWADAMVLAMAYPEKGAVARRELSAFTQAEVERRRAVVDRGGEVPDGLLSHLASAPYHDDGSRMAVEEVVGMSNQLLIAGHETSTSLITNCVWRLLEDRSRWERLVAEPSLIPNAVEESLRFDPPVLGLCRTNTEPTEVRGVVIPERSKVMMLYASANRDPAVFDRPDEFVVDRPLLETMRHYTFSWGIHYCLGAHLARLTGRIAIETLVRRFPTLHLAGPTERVSSPFLWGRKRLPVSERTSE